MGSMKDQLGDALYEYPMPRARARGTDLQTSHDAARRVETHVQQLEAAVLQAIRSCGVRGATWDELSRLTGIDKGSISPRFKPLRNKSLIAAARHSPGGDVIKRDHQTVWVAL